MALMKWPPASLGLLYFVIRSKDCAERIKSSASIYLHFPGFYDFGPSELLTLFAVSTVP
jgi:hypothetical protein